LRSRSGFAPAGGYFLRCSKKGQGAGGPRFRDDPHSASDKFDALPKYCSFLRGALSAVLLTLDVNNDRKGQYSIRINKQWRVCFKWKDNDAFDVEIVDYH
jgi:RelE-like toxin of type II toxin-antitoxin system HigB